MSNPFKPSVGMTMSADIAVPQHDRVVQFYSQVLTTGEQPLWQQDLMNNFGMPVIGIGAQSPEYAELPLQWMPHIQVANIDQSVAQAIALGGSELMQGKDEAGHRQWAVLLDPNGAAFGLVAVVADEMPPQLEDKNADELAHMGCIAWLDLTVDDAKTTRDFYTAVIGWKSEDVTMQHEGGSYSDYNMLSGDGQPVAGVCHARGVNGKVPAVWMLYLPVDDLSASLTHVKAAGGQIVNQSESKDGKITQALIQDPIGVNVVLAQG